MGLKGKSELRLNQKHLCFPAFSLSKCKRALRIHMQSRTKWIVETSAISALSSHHLIENFSWFRVLAPAYCVRNGIRSCGVYWDQTRWPGPTQPPMAPPRRKASLQATYADLEVACAMQFCQALRIPNAIRKATHSLDVSRLVAHFLTHLFNTCTAMDLRMSSGIEIGPMNIVKHH